MSPWHHINVGMNQRDTVCLPGSETHRHRGLWFYDPAVVGAEVAVGDAVVFTVFGDEVIATGTVTELVDPNTHDKLCSRINHRGFRWADLELTAQQTIELNAALRERRKSPKQVADDQAGRPAPNVRG